MQNRYADLLNTTFLSDNFDEKAETLVNQVVPEMSNHIARWNTPASVLFWLGAVQAQKDYAANRRPHAKSQVNSNLDLDGISTITLDVNPPGAGTIKISTITPESYPWEGDYFGGCMVNIEAIANENFTFESWSQNNTLGNSSTEATLAVNFGFDDLFTANFVVATGVENVVAENGLKVFPNPSSGKVNLTVFQHEGAEVNIRLYNLLGAIEFEKTIQNVSGNLSTQMDFSSQAKGVYLLEVVSGLSTHHERLVLE